MLVSQRSTYNDLCVVKPNAIVLSDELSFSRQLSAALARRARGNPRDIPGADDKGETLREESRGNTPTSRSRWHINLALTTTGVEG
jgi:hypothetical protein